MPPLLQRVAATIERHRMLHSGARVGVAVSGGADSVCLLYVLRELAPRWNLHLTVLHLNHGLRGAESREDAEFVHQLAAALGLASTIREINVAASPGNLEQAAREQRLAFFREMIESGALDRVATGHTQSDQAETVLFRFLRGAGSAGLSGIRPVTSAGIIRPLLEIDRAGVIAFLREHRIEWREDSTNASLHFARNRIRHELLPRLACEWNPAIVETLAQTADWAQAEESWWEAEVDRFAAAHLIEKGGAVLIRTKSLMTLPLAAARRLVRRAIEQSKGDLRRIGFVHVSAIVGLAAGRRGHGHVHLPGVEAVRSFDWIRLARAASTPTAYELSVTPPQFIEIPGANLQLSLELVEKSETSADREYVYNREMGCLDWRRVSGSLTLRNWRPGDRYQPVGDGGSQKLKILFQKARIPLWQRRTWPVLVDGDAIIWAWRFGPAAGVAADEEASAVLRIREVETA